jgi:hypothetical protein
VVTEAYDGTSSGCGASKPGVTGGEPLVVPPAEPVALFAAGAITSAPPSYGWYSQVQVVPADPGVAARAPGVTPITTAASSQTTSHDRGPYMPVSRHQTVTITAKAPRAAPAAPQAAQVKHVGDPVGTHTTARPTGHRKLSLGDRAGRVVPVLPEFTQNISCAEFAVADENAYGVPRYSLSGTYSTH